MASGVINSLSELRSECQEQFRSESSIHLNISNLLILKDIFYSTARGLTATTFAQRTL